MELLQLKYFCDAAETQNFSKTAKKYLVPTSNISQSVGRLERELGCELFEHRANRILLNDEGRLFYERVFRALTLIEDAKASVLEREQVLRGEIKIVCLCNRRAVTQAIERFIRQYPQVNFVLRHSARDEGDYDILISDSCPKEHGGKRLLVDEAICLAMSKSHPLSAREDISVASLESERFITMTAGSSLHAITVSTCADAGFSPNIAIQTDDPFYLRKYIELGLGIALVPLGSWSGLFAESIVLKRMKGLRRRTYAYLPKGKRTKRAVAEFLAVLESEASPPVQIRTILRQ